MTEHKSDALMHAALANDWKAEVVTHMELYDVSGDISDIMWHLYAMRGKETLHVVWRGNRLERGLYKYGDQTVKLWWKNEVVKFITGKADPARFMKRANMVISDNDELARSLPWEHDSPAIDIMLAVIRREIRWIRKFDGKVCSAVVDVDLKEKGSAKHFRVCEGKSGRVLEWADALGFHAVGLDQIIDVS